MSIINPNYAEPKTKAQRRAYYDGFKAVRQLEQDARNAIAMMDHIPPQWEDLEKTDGPAWKETQKVTMKVDKATVKFFKAMGPGYQARLNLVLRYYVQMRLAGYLVPDVGEVEEGMG